MGLGKKMFLKFSLNDFCKLTCLPCIQQSSCSMYLFIGHHYWDVCSTCTDHNSGPTPWNSNFMLFTVATVALSVFNELSVILWWRLHSSNRNVSFLLKVWNLGHISFFSAYVYIIYSYLHMYCRCDCLDVHHCVIHLPSLPPPPIHLQQLIAGHNGYTDFLLQLCDFAVFRKLMQLRDTVRNLLRLLPTGGRCVGWYCIFLQHALIIWVYIHDTHTYTRAHSSDTLVHILIKAWSCLVRHWINVESVLRKNLISATLP